MNNTNSKVGYNIVKINNNI